MTTRKRILPPNYMKVVSLFDGISCARVALERQGFNVDYYASEIDTNAIKISDKNYYSTRLGDVRNVGYIPNVDLLIGGSPCQDLSVAKKGRKGLDGARSGLFWEYLRILRLLKPRWFILENVNSMPKKDKDIISSEMGVQPIMIDAALVSAQSRKRLFWTNIPISALPVDRGIVIKDIMEPIDVSENSHIKFTAKSCSAHGRSRTGLILLGHIGNTGSQANRVYSDEGKSVTLSANGGGGGATTGLYEINDLKARQKANLRSIDDKAFCLTSTNYKGSQANGTTLIEQPKNKIRKLTPIECERLQSLPDKYTEGVATTNRYKCLGNAFNVEVIAFILSCIPPAS